MEGVPAKPFLLRPLFWLHGTDGGMFLSTWLYTQQHVWTSSATYIQSSAPPIPSVLVRTRLRSVIAVLRGASKGRDAALVRTRTPQKVRYVPMGFLAWPDWSCTREVFR